MQRLSDRLLDLSPRKVLRRFLPPGGRRSNGSQAATDGVARGKPSDALHRRVEGGQLKRFPPDYFPRRDAQITRLLDEVAGGHEIGPDFFLRGPLANYDERVVEYPIALKCLLQAAARGSVDVLDVGCVLNHALMREYVSRAARMIWFMNPSLEPSQYEKNVAFLLADMRVHQLPEELKFPLVTCLSTLEHIGMDNTRYGGGPKEFAEPPERPEAFAIEGTRNIAKLVAPGGTLLISVPYGVFEYVYTYGNTNDPIYYSFNAEMLQALEQSLSGFEVSHSIYKVVRNCGWVETDTDDRDFLKYADNCAAAGAIALIKARRPE